ncbi:uncharacterized protein LOC128349505 isoform X2 [Hemicordylus capensis]|uniref:uncharacterized protein LOC128349505 isoform X2 n=1 Tax=Hemicordylus capensis TaxID=884348 RepID=UPI0023040AEE|nr:uncharacterized protein LOC128349505 isoform X2 [Hemicordylus capensis]
MEQCVCVRERERERERDLTVQAHLAVGKQRWAKWQARVSLWFLLLCAAAAVGEVVYAGVGNAAKENVAVSSNLTTTATTPTIRLHTGRTTLVPLHLFVSQTPSIKYTKEGETVAFGCHFHISHGLPLNKLTVKWYTVNEKGQRDFMENNVTVLANFTRAFIVGNISEGDASLTILNVTANDHGIYFCQVIISSGKTVTGDGTKLRIMRGLGFFGIEDSIGTCIGGVAAVIYVIVLIKVLTPQLKKSLPCTKAATQKAQNNLDTMDKENTKVTA